MSDLQLYAIRRRDGWKTPEELETAAKLSGEIGENEMPDDIRWIRSYVVQEDDGTLGTICIYQASSAEKTLEPAKRVGRPADEITPVADVVLVRPDPEPATV